MTMFSFAVNQDDNNNLVALTGQDKYHKIYRLNYHKNIRVVY